MPESSADGPLLYELVVHGNGWRYEQTPSSEADGRWKSVRELHDGMEPLPPPALVDGAFPAGPAGSAVLDWIGALRELPLRLFNLSRRCWRASTSLAPAQRQLLGEQPVWQLALCVGAEGGSELLALWRDEDLQLYSPRDNFTTPVGVWVSGADAEPALRRLAWNGDHTMLAAANSSGKVVVLDARARVPCWCLEEAPSSRTHPYQPA